MLGGNKSCSFSGRLLGGCLDTLVHLVGTPYGEVPKFASDHKSDGLILFLENCELSPSGVARSLWQMRLAGWFNNLRAIVFGRSSAADAREVSSLSYVDALETVLGDLKIPIIFDADIGHRPPQMILVNGAFADIEYVAGTGTVKQKFI